MKHGAWRFHPNSSPKLSFISSETSAFRYRPAAVGVLTFRRPLRMTSWGGISAEPVSGSGPKPINFLRGWPSPSTLPAAALKAAADRVFSDPSVYVPALQYAPDPGYQPLREALAIWLSRFYHVIPDPARICVTGGASQSAACILQSYTDPLYTRNVWMVAPCYFLACPIFADSGFGAKMRAVPEDDEGINLEYLEREMQAVEDSHPRDDEDDRVSVLPLSCCMCVLISYEEFFVLESRRQRERERDSKPN